MPDTGERKSYSCPVCNDTHRKLLYTIKGFAIVQCESCTLAYVNPRIPNENLYNMYTRHYFSNKANGYENYELIGHLRIKTFQKWYSEIEPFLKKKSGAALDIGCAAGYFLQVLEKKGWEAEGIELEEKMNAHVRNKGYTVYNSPLEFFKENKKYQLISLFDVIEHLPKLSKNIEKLSSILDDTGSIVLVTPDLNSRQRKIFGKRWFQFKPLEHIQYFTLSSLKKAFEKHNLYIVYHSSSGQFADTFFMHSRLRRYNFTVLAWVFKTIVTLLRLQKLSWYADTGSMLIVFQKRMKVRNNGSP